MDIGSAEEKPAKKRFEIKWPKAFDNEWVSIVLFVAGVAVAYFIISAFLYRTYQVDGQSMETTLQHGDRLIIDKIPRTLAHITGNAYIPHRGDIIVFNQSGQIFGSSAEKQLIKRVVGLPGERVVVKDGILSIYNQASPGGFQPDKTGLYNISTPTTVGDVDINLKSDQIFVCGDNRGNSEDSRFFGAVQADKIVGKLTLRVLPINKADKF